MVDSRPVIPAKARKQLRHLWIPAFAGKTIVGKGDPMALGSIHR